MARAGLRSAAGVIVVAWMMAGCARQENTFPAAVPRIEPGCALGLAGSKVVAEPTANGMSLSFTSADQPYVMRERAHSAAAQHGQGAAHGLQMTQGPAASTAATDIEGGARIDFVPADPGELEALRRRLRQRTVAMNADHCDARGLQADHP